MRWTPGRAATIAARPLAFSFASAAIVAGMLTLPAPVSHAAQQGHPPRTARAVSPLGTAAPSASPVFANPAKSTGAIRGVLHGITGRPAGGVCLVANGQDGFATATTQRDGGYLLGGLHQGRYALAIVSCPGHAASVPPALRWSSLPSSATVTAGHVTKLKPATAWQLSRAGLSGTGQPGRLRPGDGERQGEEGEHLRAGDRPRAAAPEDLRRGDLVRLRSPAHRDHHQVGQVPNRQAARRALCGAVLRRRQAMPRPGQLADAVVPEPDRVVPEQAHLRTGQGRQGHRRYRRENGPGRPDRRRRPGPVRQAGRRDLRRNAGRDAARESPGALRNLR